MSENPHTGRWLAHNHKGVVSSGRAGQGKIIQVLLHQITGQAPSSNTQTYLRRLSTNCHPIQGAIVCWLIGHIADAIKAKDIVGNAACSTTLCLETESTGDIHASCMQARGGGAGHPDTYWAIRSRPRAYVWRLTFDSCHVHYPGNCG